MFQFLLGSCYPRALFGVYVGLVCVDGFLAVISFLQLLRIHSRNLQIGWTRQKVFHLMIGSSNLGFVLYFILSLVAACKDWASWSHICGFIIMAFPQIIFFAAFLLLLSFWVDLCHQTNDDEDDDDGYYSREALLEKTNKENAVVHHSRKCCSLRALQVGSRQKIVILVILLILVLMVTSSMLMWIGKGDNPIDSSLVARVYVDLFSAIVLSLGGALAGYGLVLYLKMSKVRSDRVSSEKKKVAGLAIVSVLCFSSNAVVAVFTNIPLLYDWNQQTLGGVYTSLLLLLYYFLGTSVPAASLLWVMRELPPPLVTNRDEESRMIAFINDGSVTAHPQRWAAAACLQNQVSRASPI
ncbi:OLC1v1022143C3 [Oldenlandia corymbosa var. corymbosa]|uniref:OLC1v1022143C3 n=2 Tax=Oldenlandia corymbosa var. corymbosa TaxID=529605 RepID=A0AAV1BXC8_OLDCO|nr:OLC1v1022143C3 [Oldenlandia corymbosa var. corymbosa]